MQLYSLLYYFKVLHPAKKRQHQNLKPLQLKELLIFSFIPPKIFQQIPKTLSLRCESKMGLRYISILRWHP